MDHARAAALRLSSLTLLALLTAVGCGSGSDSGAVPPPADWDEPDAYRYTFVSSAGEQALIGEYTVTVERGEVTKAVGHDSSTRLAVENHPREIPTLGELLDRYETARVEGAEHAEVTYAKDDHPEQIILDWSEDAIDDESNFMITDYRPTGRSRASRRVAKSPEVM